MINNTQMAQIKHHMPVVASNNDQLGVVDHVDGQNLKLTRDERGQHHYIPLDWISTVDDKVHVDRPGEQVLREWSTRPA